MDWKQEVFNTVGKANKRNLKPISNVDMQLLKNSKTIYIFTTYCQDHHVMLGNLGQWYLKGVDTHGSTNRDDWDRYRLATTLQSRLFSYDTTGKGDIGPFHQGDGSMDYTVYDGIEIATDMLKRTETGNKNLENWGVFASMHETPTEEELNEAFVKLTNHLTTVVQEADRLSMGNIADQNAINIKHRNAANYLKLSRSWSRGVEVLIGCPYCSTPIRETSPVCPNCHNVTNRNLMDAITAKVESAKKTTTKA